MAQTARGIDEGARALTPSRRIAAATGAMLLLAYVVQFVMAGWHGGQPRALGVMVHVLANERLAELMTPALPRMRVIAVFGGRERCRLWNFEALWGRCVDVSLDVLEHAPTHTAAIDALAAQLTADLARPCSLVKPNRSEAVDQRRTLECGSSRRPYRVTTNVRIVEPGPGGLDNTSDKFFWNRRFSRDFGTYQMKGGT